MDWFYAYIHSHDRMMKLKRTRKCDCQYRASFHHKDKDTSRCNYHHEVFYAPQNGNILHITPLFEAPNASVGWDLGIQYCRLAGYIETMTFYQDNYKSWHTAEELNWTSVQTRFAKLDL